MFAAPLLRRKGWPKFSFRAFSGLLVVRTLRWKSATDLLSLSKLMNSVTNLRGTTMSTSLSPPLVGGWKSEQEGHCGNPRAPLDYIPQSVAFVPGRRELAVALTPFIPPIRTISKER